MLQWNFLLPDNINYFDKQIKQIANSLQGKKLALLISGSIAAYQTPSLVRLLRKYGAEVKVFCSHSALDFVTKKALSWTSDNLVCTELSAQVEHLGEEKFDLYILAPASYNTINKFANGSADSVLTTTLSSALGYLNLRKTKILICPTCHYSMHNILLVESLQKLSSYGVLIHPPRQENGKNKLPELSLLVKNIISIFND